MGGSGSGRWGSRKLLAERLARLDLKRIRAQTRLNAASTLTVQYRSGTQRAARTIHLRATPAGYGGSRLWFICPACGGNRQVLYCASRVACGRCLKVTYSSQRETRSARALRGMTKIIKRLDPDAESNDLPDKPEGMQWATYERLTERYDRLDEVWAIEVMGRFLRHH